MKSTVRIMALVLFCVLTMPIAKAATFDYKGLSYSTITDGIMPEGYSASDYAGCCEIIQPATPYSGDIEIPEYVIYNGAKFLVTRIGKEAFSEYTVEGENPFEKDNLINSVTMPNSITEIADYAFTYAFNLQSLTLSGNLKSMGKAVFAGTSITEITIPEGVTELPSNMCAACASLETVNLPSTLTKVEEKVFFGCKTLPAISIPEGVTYIGTQAFEQCLALQSVSLPSTLETIDDSAFEWCHSLASIEIPNSVKTIGKSAFEWCSGLTELVIPDSVETICESAFVNCEGLKVISLGSGLKSIGEYAFHGCDDLESVTCYSLTTPDVYDNSFSSYDAYLYVHDSVVALYDDHSVWTKFNDITTGIDRNEVTSSTDVVINGNTISITCNLNTTNPQTIIFNLDGGVVYSGNESHILISTPGVYVVRVTAGADTIVKKIVIK